MELIDPVDPVLSKTRKRTLFILMGLNVVAFAWAVGAALGVAVPYSPMSALPYPTEHAVRLMTIHLWLSVILSVFSLGVLWNSVRRQFFSILIVLLMLMGFLVEISAGVTMTVIPFFELHFPGLAAVALLHGISSAVGLRPQILYPDSIAMPWRAAIPGPPVIVLPFIVLFSAFLFSVFNILPSIEFSIFVKGLAPIEGFGIALVSLVVTSSIAMTPFVVISTFPMILLLATFIWSGGLISRHFAVGVYRKHPMEHRFLPRTSQGQQYIKVSKTGVRIQITIWLLAILVMLALIVGIEFFIIDNPESWLSRLFFAVWEHNYESVDGLFVEPRP